MTMIYLLECSAFDFLQTGLLRRIVCAVPVIIDMLSRAHKERKIRLLPGHFRVLIFPMIIQCLQSVPASVTAFMRTGFWFVWLDSMYLHTAGKTHRQIEETYMRFAWIFVLIHTAGCLIFWDRYSLNNDWLGMYANRNMTVSVSMSAAVLCLFLKRKYPLIPAVLIAVNILMAFRTGSRMAAVLSAILLCFRIMKKPCRILFCLPVLLAGFGKNMTGIASVDRLLSSGDASGLFRGTWQIGTDLFLERPLFGHGMHTAYYYTFIENHGGWGWGTHNSWLVILAENGIVGALFYAVFFMSVIVQMNDRYRNDSLKEWKELCFLLMIMTAVNAVSESFLFSPGNVMSLPFWFTLICVSEDPGI